VSARTPRTYTIGARWCARLRAGTLGLHMIRTAIVSFAIVSLATTLGCEKKSSTSPDDATKEDGSPAEEESSSPPEEEVSEEEEEAPGLGENKGGW
jgi:hypothetical protein